MVSWILEMDRVEKPLGEKKKKKKDPRVSVDRVYTVMSHDAVLSPSVFFKDVQYQNKQRLTCFVF